MRQVKFLFPNLTVTNPIDGTLIGNARTLFGTNFNSIVTSSSLILFETLLNITLFITIEGNLAINASNTTIVVNSILTANTS